MSSVQDDNSQEVFSRSQSPDWECIHKLTSPK